MKILKLTVLSIFILMLFPGSFSFASMSPERTAEYMKKAMNYTDSIVIAKANVILQKYPDNKIDQLCEAFDMLYLNWKYRSDPDGKEKFYKASTSLKTFKGDCDDYAIAMVSLMVALGGNGRVVCVIDHAFPEVYLGKNLSHGYLDSLPVMINAHYAKTSGHENMMTTAHYHKDADGSVWLNMDWWEYYPGSKFHNTDPDAEHIVIYPDGTYEVTFLNKTGQVFPLAN
ncbi:MAG: transglutaminase domain-containing protein [Ignavibacteriae bacterium]|nr:MAG: transglutaminase domain-containing protein [Ignavibacteriota bacterium]